VSYQVGQRDEGVEMIRSCNEDGATVKISLPCCVATLGKGLGGNNADDSYDSKGTFYDEVLPSCIR